MHILLVVGVVLWFAFIAPPHVVAFTAAGCFLIAASVRVIAAKIGGVQVGYASSLKAVFLSIFLLSLAILALAGGIQNLTFASLLGLNPMLVPAILLGAYVLGFHLCLGTTFGTSTIIALLSTIASIAIIAMLKAIA